MKTPYRLFLMVALFFSVQSFSQQQLHKTAYNGAKATKGSYNALFFINESDDKKIRAIIRNINNSLNDPRLKGKLKVELLAFGDGVEMYKKSNGYDSLLMALKDRGVLLVQCENTIREREIDKGKLLPYISYVPSGVGEIIILQSQGWATVHP